MKKMIVLVMCAALAVTLVACGNSSSEETTETEEETVETEEADAGETEEAEEDSGEPELVTTDFMGMSFSYPAGCEYTTNEDTATINLEPGASFAMILAQDLSESSELADVYLEIAPSGVLSGFDQVENREDFDTTMGGLDAKGATALVYTNDVWASYMVVSAYNPETEYLYTVTIAEGGGVEHEDYIDLFYNSISFGSEASATEDNAEAADTAENESAAAHFDGYDIIYQNYELFENSRGEVRLYAIVEVENTGNTNLQLRDGNFTFTDAEGNLAGMASYGSSEDPDIIKPGERGYFYLNDAKLDGDLSVEGEYVFEPELSFKETDKDPVVFEVSDTSISEGSHDKADVMGRVTNPTDEDYDYLSVAVVLFDQSDNPIAVYTTTVKDLTAGGTSSFDAEATALRDMSFSFNDVARYEVIASK